MCGDCRGREKRRGELIDPFAGNGGLIIDGTIGIPDEARRENVVALSEAAMQYGAARDPQKFKGIGERDR